MKAPFPYFGGKASIADDIWRYLGDPDHYIEPFFGSGAVLLNRKQWENKTETVCDKDGFIANVWRSIQFSPDETAEYCDWPVNHIDLIARKRELIKNEERLLENLASDTEWHDVKMAGYWIWAASCWIGSGLTRPNQRPHLTDKGNGVHKASLGKRPHLTTKGMGVHKVSLGPRPHLSGKGMGVHKASIGPRPHLGSKGEGVH
jgi:DNA adenine methylase